jgi:nitroreductase
METALAYPHGESTMLRAAFALRYAILAPSSHNSQPWLFHVEGDTIELYADRSRALPVVDPDHRELTISCGAALHHLRTAFAAVGQAIEVTRTCCDDRLARVRLVGDRIEPNARARRRLEATLDRRTVRAALVDPPRHDAVVKELEAAAREEGASLVFADRSLRDRIADLVAAADVEQASSRDFRHELSRWLHSNHSTRDDGMPAATLGMGTLGSLLAPLAVRAYDWGKQRARKDHDLVEHSPLVAVLGTPGDVPNDWLTAGEALSAMLLDAAAHGIAASFLNQPVEIESLRATLASIVWEAEVPQLVLRLGIPFEEPREIERSARRALEEVVV